MKRSRLLYVMALGLIMAVTVLLSSSTPALAIPPTVASATPNQGGQGQTLSVIIVGTDFTGASAVSFGAGVTTTAFTVDNDTQITAAVSIDAAAAVGARDVSVTNVDGNGTLTGGFTVLAAPEVVSVSPGQGNQGQTENVTITGSNFTGATAVDFGSGVTTNSFTVTPSAGASEVQIGTGTNTEVYPFRVYWLDVRTQSILLASEIGQPGVIQKLRLYCTQRPGQDLQTFCIRMQHTTMDAFPSTSFVNGGWTTVLQTTNVDVDAWTVPGWVEFDFDTPFDYDGTGNLLIDYCVETSTQYVNNGYCQTTSTSGYRTLWVAQNLAGGDLLNSAAGTRDDFHNNVVLVMQGDTIEADITIDGAAASGYRDVTVTTPAGSDNITDGFMVIAPPAISSITPTEADQGATASIAITGTDFFGVTAVGFGAGTAVNSFSVDNNTQITASVTVSASAAIGPRDVSVTNAAGTDNLTNGFTVDQAPPAITAVSPAEGIQGQTENVTISGDYFTGATSVDFGPGVTTNSFVVTPGGGAGEVQVGTGTAGVALPFYNTYFDSRTESILLASEIGQPGVIGSLRLYCTQRPGQDLSHFYIRMQHTSMSSFPSTSFTNTGWTTVLHATDVDVDAWAAPGWVEFEFTTPFDYDGTSNLLVDYCMDNSYSTTYGICDYTAGANRSLYYAANLAGDALNQATATSRLNYYNNVVLVMDADTIEANITIDGGATPGYRDVAVTTAEGVATESNGFLVVGVPGLTTVNPAQGLQGETVSVVLTGSNLFATTVVDFGAGTTTNSFNVDNDTQITASITVGAAATPGFRDVSVTNAAGTATLTNGFLVDLAPPDVTSVNPLQGVQTQSLDVVLAGNYFTGATSVSFGAGITTNSYTVDSANQITANISIAAGATAGVRDVTVTTPGGTDTLTSGFTVLTMPSISAVSPTEADQGASLPVTITGANFNGVTAVGFGAGIAVDSFTVDTDAQITASITINDGAAVGARDVSVTKTGVSATLPNGFTVDQAPPVAGPVVPGQGVQGQTENVTVTGSHFTGTTSVDFGPGVTVNSFVVTPAGGLGEVQVGTGTTTQSWPFYTLWEDSRTQSILLASEIGQSGQIRRVRLYCTDSGRDLENFYIRMQHTSMSSFASATFVNGGLSTVLHATTVDVDSWVVPGWVEFELDTPFDYNGVDNLLIDYCVDNGGWSSSSPCYSTAAANRTIYYRDDLGGANALNQATGTMASYYNNVVLVMDADTIEANITVSGAATPGYRDVTVTTPEGTDTQVNGFMVVGMPAVTSVSPNQAIQGETTGVTITGTNLFGVTAVDFGAGVTVNTFTVDSNSQITANITVGGLAIPGTRDVSATNAAGTGTLTGGFTVNQAPPNIVGVAPVWAVVGQTLDVVITGSSFTGATTVNVSAGVGTNTFSVDSDAQITASITIGAGAAAGLRDVSVTTPWGTDTLPNGFTVLGIPAVTQVNPGQAVQGQTLNVTITGSNLTAATGVDVGAGITTNGYSVDSASQITANISIGGAAAAGMRDVSVTAPGGTATLPSGFMVVAVPALVSVAPTEADQGETTNVVISGTDLLGVTAVDFGAGVTVNSFAVDNSTQITASISVSASATVGTRDVSVTNAAGTDTITAGFTVDQAPPAIAAVSPGQGVQGQTENVTITGGYFTGATSVSFGDNITVNSFSVDSDTQITANITIDGAAAVGYRDVSVATPEGTDTEANGFMVVAVPTLASVAPTEADQGQTASVTITGTNLYGVTTVGFGADITVNSFTVDNNTQITAIISISASATVGPRDVSVANAAGTDTLSGGFTVDQAPPAIDSVSPNQGIQGQTENVTITGHYFTGTTAVSFGAGITTDNFTVDSDTQITAVVTIDAAAAAGYRDVSVTTDEGTATAANGLTVIGIPTLVSVSPGQAVQGQALNVTITGANLIGVTGVNFGLGVTVNSSTVVSASQITASITVSGSATPGARTAAVTNAAGTGVLSGGFTINQAPPTVTGVNPQQGQSGQTLTVTVWGTYLTSASALSFGADVTVTSFNVNNSSQITASISIGGSAVSGPRNVTVTTPGGTATLANGFAVAGLPAVGSVSPGQASQGETASVTITGSGFLGATALSFGEGITVDSFTVDSATQITASINVAASAAAGVRDVTVTTAEGSGSLTGGFNVVEASTADGEVTPASGRPGATVVVVIAGSNFTGATALSFGEGVTVESFTVDSDTQITAHLVVADDAAPGDRSVMVTTPEGTVTLSDVFEVQAPEGEPGGGGIPVFVWPLIGVLLVVGSVALGLVIRRRKKQQAAG